MLQLSKTEQLSAPRGSVRIAGIYTAIATAARFIAPENRECMLPPARICQSTNAARIAKPIGIREESL